MKVIGSLNHCAAPDAKWYAYFRKMVCEAQEVSDGMDVARTIAAASLNGIWSDVKWYAQQIQPG